MHYSSITQYLDLCSSNSNELQVFEPFIKLVGGSWNPCDREGIGASHSSRGTMWILPQDKVENIRREVYVVVDIHGKH